MTYTRQGRVSWFPGRPGLAGYRSAVSRSCTRRRTSAGWERRTRTVHATVPPKVEYELTQVARELHVTLLSLTDRAERHRGTIAEVRAAYDAQHRPELLDA